MMPSPFIWFRLASLLMPEEKSPWLMAMQAELWSIEEGKARHYFAFGCFCAVLSEWCRSRKGLNIIGRSAGALLLVSFSAFAIYSAGHMAGDAETVIMAKIISNLGYIYLLAAAFLLVSLRILQGFAGLGFIVAISVWLYVTVSGSMMNDILVKFYLALSIEVAGIMAFLFLSSVYLKLVYSEGVYENP